MDMPVFEPFGKIPRLTRGCFITEKIDGTNAQVHILEDGRIFAGSRNRYLTRESDNFGFAKWVEENTSELSKLGPGRHFGEWYGKGIQRGYGLEGRRFALFNSSRWVETPPPECCHVVPVLFTGEFSTNVVDDVIAHLRAEGSVAVPGFKNPEGIIVYHKASGGFFKKLLENDDKAKGEAA